MVKSTPYTLHVLANIAFSCSFSNSVDAIVAYTAVKSVIIECN